MTTHDNTKPAAVVAFDFSDTASIALQTAFELSATRPDIAIHMVTVADGPAFPEKFDNQTLVNNYLKIESALATTMHQHVRSDTSAVFRSRAVGIAAVRIRDQSRIVGEAAVIVVAPAGSGASE